MGCLRTANLFCAFLAVCGTCTVTSGHARSLKQIPACITSTTTVNATTDYPATDPLCLKVGDFSVHCPPDQPCACPTLKYVNVTSVSNNLLGCYSPSQYFCSAVGPQWAQTAASYGHTALIQGSGESNIGVCWNPSNQTLSDWGTANNALLPSAVAVAKASADAITAAAPPAAAPEPSPSPGAAGFQDPQDSPAGKIVGIVFAVVGPSVATILWLSITFSYRQEKAVIINGVQQQIATSSPATVPH
ncbi:hypothetical protein ABBQ32_012728 [Trebouxia sp. C0010 RCD-2024]